MEPIREKGNINIAALKRSVWERDNFTCQYCGMNMRDLYLQWKEKKIKRLKALLSVDHVLPKSKGGRWIKKNLVTSCIPCNHKKSNTLV